MPSTNPVRGYVPSLMQTAYIVGEASWTKPGTPIGGYICSYVATRDINKLITEIV